MIPRLLTMPDISRIQITTTEQFWEKTDNVNSFRVYKVRNVELEAIDNDEIRIRFCLDGEFDEAIIINFDRKDRYNWEESVKLSVPSVLYEDDDILIELV